eukprot:UN01728
MEKWNSFGSAGSKGSRRSSSWKPRPSITGVKTNQGDSTNVAVHHMNQSKPGKSTSKPAAKPKVTKNHQKKTEEFRWCR